MTVTLGWELAAMVAAACAYRFVPIALHATSWRRLLRAGTRPPVGRTLLLRWIGEAVNSIVPWAQVGGDVVRARLLRREGVPSTEAHAAMLVDLGLGALTQAAFTCVGAVGVTTTIARPTPLAVGGGVAAMLGAFGLVRWGADGALRRAERSPRWRWLAAHAQALRSLGDRRRALVAAGVWHLVGWVAHVGETWGVLHALGSPVSLRAALALESLAYAARTAAFFVPGGIGAQEAALLLVGHGLGIPTGTLTALAIVKRARELAVGAGGLAAWWWVRRRPGQPPAPST